ncbi:hypothetical protein [Listeria riparia]|uniref:Uncharacterized protein n=1 Tax=Listeria riparia FSL S10-1204 TaxID=1265816 RepID=W7DHT5_9LIST|nr:hypothetical protein [Listeria riparia]EUJ44908.1 hypothetical protein PRIP_08727 [Listeria riparia FSL S10-1204]
MIRIHLKKTETKKENTSGTKKESTTVDDGNGNKVTVDENGVSAETSDGAEAKAKKDGTVTVDDGKGNSVDNDGKAESSDGAKRVVNPDGSVTVDDGNGKVVTTDKDGKVTVENK